MYSKVLLPSLCPSMGCAERTATIGIGCLLLYLLVALGTKFKAACDYFTSIELNLT